MEGREEEKQRSRASSLPILLFLSPSHSLLFIRVACNYKAMKQNTWNSVTNYNVLNGRFYGILVFGCSLHSNMRRAKLVVHHRRSNTSLQSISSVSFPYELKNTGDYVFASFTRIHSSLLSLLAEHTLSLPPQFQDPILSSTGYSLSVRTPVDSEHFICMTRKIDQKLLRPHIPKFERRIFGA